METKYSISTLYGVQIITYEEGLRLGKVSEVYITEETKKIEGISFSTGRIGVGKEYFVNFADIHRIGKDAIIISSESATLPLPAEHRGIGWKTLKGLKVMTFSGEELGELSDLNMAKSNGEVSSLILTEGKILEIKLDDLTIGADALMVPVDYASRIQELQKKPDTLQAFQTEVQSLKEKVKGAFQETADKVEKTVGNIFGKSDPAQKKEKSNAKFNDTDNVEKP
jgi:sporulation protein YlmC with PRC-barrel domain